MLSWWDESICIYSGQFGCFRKGCVVMLAEISQNSACWTDNLLMCAGDFAYLPKMQFLNLGGVLLCLWITFQNNLGLGGIWWCLVFYFGFRVFFHSCYIANHWRTHVSYLLSRNPGCLVIWLMRCLIRKRSYCYIIIPMFCNSNIRVTKVYNTIRFIASHKSFSSAEFGDWFLYCWLGTGRWISIFNSWRGGSSISCNMIT